MPKSKKRRKAPAPSKFGIARQFIADNYSAAPVGLEELKNGHVLFTYYECEKKLMETVRRTELFFKDTPVTPSHIQVAITSLVKKTIDHYKHLTMEREMTKFQAACEQPFQVGAKRKASVPNKSSQTPVSPQAPSTSPSSATTPCVMTRSSALLTPRKERLRKTLDFTRESVRQQKIRILQLRMKLKTPKKVINQALKRKEKIIRRKEEENKELISRMNETSLGSELLEAKLQIQRLKATHMRVRQYWRNKKKLCDHGDLLKVKDEEIKRLQHENLLLQEAVEEQQQDCEASKKPVCLMQDGKTYSSTTRMLVFDFITNKVPMESIPELVEQSLVRFGCNIERGRVPKRSAVEFIVRELGAISELQTADVLLGSTVTLGFDATTQEGTHINAIHFTTKDSCVVASVEQLPGGTACDYSNHILSTVDSLAATYSYFKDADYSDTRTKMISNIRYDTVVNF